jgi:NADP-dependent 3-hydroxy acid dehydrogenase YdfG
LILNYTSDSSASQIAALAKELETQYSIICFAIQADISSPKGSGLLVQAARDSLVFEPEKKFQIDIIINNAGVACNATIQEFEIQAFDWMYRINVLGSLLLIQAALPYLPHDRSDHILNFSSTSSTEGFIGQSIYGDTKSAPKVTTRT